MKAQTLLLLALGLASMPAPAQSTAPPASVPVPQPEFGKLFLSPERRVQLERQRQLNIREAQNLESDTLQLNGVVQRSSGRNSVWLNQQMRGENDPQGGGTAVKVHRQRPSEASVGVDEASPVRLQVGESLNRSTGERSDIVTPGGVRVVKPVP